MMNIQVMILIKSFARTSTFSKSETGYYYLQSRYYDPSICRFINADLTEIAGLTKNITIGLNLFAYCNNDPIDLLDFDGYWAEKLIYNIKKNSYDVKVCWSFLSKQYCLSFAKDLIKNIDRVTNRGSSKIKGVWINMTAHRMAVEIWFHAMIYYGGYPLAKICNKFRTSIWDRANPITVNSDDNRAPYFYTAWYSAAAIKVLLLNSHVSSLVKIGAAIIL